METKKSPKYGEKCSGKECPNYKVFTCKKETCCEYESVSGNCTKED